MRQAGTLTEKQDAERFSDYLLTQGIESKVDSAADRWAIWILDENQLDRSKQELAEFNANPADPRYEGVSREAQAARRQLAKQQKQASKNFVDMRTAWDSPVRGRPVSAAMIGISVVVGLVTEMGRNFDTVLPWLLISTHLTDLNDILHGEVWRLVTPIFVHFGWMHLLFNMLWLNDLGAMIERRLGSLRFAGLVLLVAVPSNLAQYFVSGPLFGGMSGVVYALLGYAWIRTHYDPACGMYVHPRTVQFMLIWFVVCFTPLIGHVANTAHGVGLAMGAALGYLPRLRRLLK